MARQISSPLSSKWISIIINRLETIPRIRIIQVGYLFTRSSALLLAHIYIYIYADWTGLYSGSGIIELEVLVLCYKSTRS